MTTKGTLPPLPEVVLPAPLAPVGPDRPSLESQQRMQPKKSKEKPGVQYVSNQSIDPAVSLSEAREALVGIPADLLTGRGTPYEIFTQNNRLRGIGVLLIVAALFVAVLQLF